MPAEHLRERVGWDRRTRRVALDAALARLPETAQRVDGEHGPGRDAIALPGPLAELLPQGVRRGQATVVREAGDGLGYCSLAIMAAALAQGLWCAAVAVAGLGGLALAESLKAQDAGAGALQRLLVVSDPGERWVDVAAVLADGVDLVMLQPAATPSAMLTRRLSARIRQGAQGAGHRAALIAVLVENSAMGCDQRL